MDGDAWALGEGVFASGTLAGERTKRDASTIGEASRL